jgi:hypothetical protein
MSSLLLESDVDWSEEDEHCPCSRSALVFRHLFDASEPATRSALDWSRAYAFIVEEKSKTIPKGSNFIGDASKI